MADKNAGPFPGEFPSLPKQERALQKRKALLESGRRLFIEKGYELTTAKDIAAAADVATGTFYRYFSDKRQLLMALLQDKIDFLMIPEPDWLSEDPVLLLARLLDEHYKRLEAVGIHRVLPELVPKDSELAGILQEARRNIHMQIVQGLELARQKGLTWKDIDLDTAAWSALILAENGPDKEEQSSSPLNTLEAARIICRMIFPPEAISRNVKNDAGNME
ncbi:TetR/AcrR family transcriptional regulator [Bacillus infantis]|uniref:TetR/AcrR family transcriptional regulator n=1 Tax=Bacillus infantis TaxID=324767 RepID=UPI002155E3AE|nr:TetR/AcrR family transcriptional regulator [Bacillus infantis]MCR6611125.1 TetR/AcrR family transcriptional regulator [Bacillus infantis]